MHYDNIKKEKNKKKCYWIFLLFIFLAFTMSYVFSAGGGGGGSSGGSGGGGSGGSGDNLYFTILECDDAGKISFTQNPKNENFVIENFDDGNSLGNIPGEWDGPTFTSDEAVIVKQGRYKIADAKNGNRTFECPGLKFSCKLIGLSISQCIVNKTSITAKFNLSNVEPEELKFQFTLPGSNRILEYQKGSYSKELKGIKINKEGENFFSLEVNKTIAVESLQVSHPKCVGKYYIYSTIKCRESFEAQKEEPGKKLKCGGYLDIQDRVKCRLRLREDEAGEYENFFPEECRAKPEEGQESCLKVYQSVQECWDFPNGNARISCVKKQIKLGDVFAEKANCNALDAGKRENCNKELRDKVYELIKFRLYNLEEEAEKLMEQGRLEEQDVVDFIVKMEQSKLAFNKASNKEERKNTILNARKAWAGLMREMEQ